MTWEQSAWAAWWFLPFVAPLGLWVAWSDLRSMKIPNKAVLATLAVFVVIGPIALPLESYLWRYAHFAVVLVIGFVLSSIGALGAGDAKFAAAMAPFIALGDVVGFFYLFAATLMASFILHRLARTIPALRNRAPGWESWARKRDFPMGLALGPALAFYQVAVILAA